jgi:hypothetical protein
MKRIIITATVSLVSALCGVAQETHFLPGHLAVLRAGDGVIPLIRKQSPVFIDQFDTNVTGATPSFSVAIPTTGTESFFFNGHAATEGMLTRSANAKLLVFAGYGGMDLLKESGTAARLDIQRGACTVDAAGKIHTYLFKSGSTEVKANPRGATSDGTNNFWGAGNASGTYYYDAASHPDQPVRFNAFPSSRAVKIINNVVYVSINAPDATASGKTAGVYDFLPESLPRASDAQEKLLIPAADPYQKAADFDINPAGNTAYMADAQAGIQKYVKSGDAWKFAYNFSIPQNISKDENNAAGCFGLTVDFSGAAPVIYATTTEGYGGSVNSNRVVRIVDTNSSALVETLIQAGSTNIAYRGISFTPN